MKMNKGVNNKKIVPDFKTGSLNTVGCPIKNYYEIHDCHLYFY